MPRFDAPATSMVFTPAPARTISDRLPASSIGSVTFVDRTVGGAIPPIYVTGLVSPEASGAIVNGATVEPQSPGTGDRAEVTHVAGDFLDLDIAHFGPTSLRAGDDWRTTASVRNNGPATEPGPIRVVIEQQSATPKRASGEGWTCDVDGRRITCVTDGPLAMGASLPGISVVSTTPRAGTQVNSVATVTGKREDVDRSNNRSATSAVLERDADIAVRKEADSSTVAAGGTATYRITLTNRGPGSTSDAQITDTLPAKRFGDPAEFGAACAFLCGAKAGFMTGQNLQMDGGAYAGLI